MVKRINKKEGIFMTYSETLSYLHNTPRFPAVPSLSRIQALLKKLGDPQKTLRFLHIAGTNGKGSTAAMTASILTAAGYRTGLFTSPYLEEFEERFQTNGISIGKEDLCIYAAQVKEAADALAKEKIQLTEFELVTAIGFLYFKDQLCDFVVLETGLGGRFDATNIITPPLAAAITSISRDHVQTLGNTLEQIANEKCGILKPGSYAVTTSHQAPEVLDVIQRTCQTQKIPLCIAADAMQIASASFSLFGTKFFWQGTTYQIPLLGQHQIENALLALELARIIRKNGFPISKEAEQQGLASVSWPGRLELFSKQPMILLDTAHNPGGIEVLCQALSQYASDRNIHTIMGMFRDKAFEFCVTEIAKRSICFYATLSPEPARAVSVSKTAEIAKKVCKQVEYSTDLEDTLKKAICRVDTSSMLLICGSIPLVGASRTILRQLYK